MNTLFFCPFLMIVSFYHWNNLLKNRGVQVNTDIEKCRIYGVHRYIVLICCSLK